ncbi:hypothetical protein CFPU101_14610 [Chroococcus sp. FPU101]|nr:hypothetical protein CFPU101_14610 [Chroococcus sp. FPU101]
MNLLTLLKENKMFKKRILETDETLTTLSEKEVRAIMGGLKIKRADVIVVLPPTDLLNY